ncbi:hypothetical protein CCL45_gp17 [Sulfolobus islandicus rod-shaped virus 5]|uniref:Uncharacterized protein n=1 Tax=Sulfolobus islandicus rod-shaped virus 5 TaxID=1983548 RepID=A0A1X9SK91_9VIRU|nr:hypothetical protein CCL43_gp16 [Sulfolobus islandicus rod-shaped virus 7]YP_009362627.1 hypothetical protein CCL45_gp17 [Sulfolobus islandicus rod-shaped virus 5]ARQ96586.1 hypothetical protein [Sulfolobus islandicus rod-shaped virus 7]ARQ96639.1 hypothetical protein [Sulfolobus islandicus rod-shaped virus 5]
MGKLAFRLYIFIILSIVILNILLIFSEGILSKNSQNIVLYSAIVSILLAIIFTWIIDLIDDLDTRINKLELEIKRLKQEINLSENEK